MPSNEIRSPVRSTAHARRRYRGIEGPDRSGGQVQGGADDAVGVDAVVAVQIPDRPGLAELGHAQRGVRYTVDGGQERQRVRVTVQDGDQRGGAGRGERLLEDPRLTARALTRRALAVYALTGAQRAEQQPRAGHAHHVGWRADL